MLGMQSGKEGHHQRSGQRESRGNSRDLSGDAELS